jgi:hypothetical protein
LDQVRILLSFHRRHNPSQSVDQHIVTTTTTTTPIDFSPNNSTHTTWTLHQSPPMPTATAPSASSLSSTWSRLSCCSFRPVSLQAMLSLPLAWSQWLSRAWSVRLLSAARAKALMAGLSCLERISRRRRCLWFSWLLGTWLWLFGGRVRSGGFNVNDGAEFADFGRLVLSLWLGTGISKRAMPCFARMGWCR